MLSYLLFGIGAFVFIATRGKSSAVLNTEKFRSSWLAIEQKLQSNLPDSYILCVMNADKLLDLALRQRGFKGETMGERMKSAQNEWRDANVVWRSHKLRNQLAHEHDVQLSYDQARAAMAGFKQGLKDLGAI